MNWRTPHYVAATLALASFLALAAPAPAPAAPPDRARAPVPARSASIPVQNNGNNVIQIGSGPGTYWINDGVWGAAALTLGTYTGENGTSLRTGRRRQPEPGAQR